MRKEDDVASGRDTDQSCDHNGRRVIRLRLPYGEVSVVRARLVTENGSQFDVSPVYRIDAGWAFSICRECAKRSLIALAIFCVLLAVP